MLRTGFIRNRSANIAIIVALVALPLTALFGMSVETSTLSRQRKTVQDAADSAAIAGVAFLYKRGISAENAWRFRDQVEAAVGDGFAANAPRCGGNAPLDVDINGDEIRVRANCLSESIFGRLVGQQSRQYRVDATAQFQTLNNLDIMFMLDTTTEMCDTWAGNKRTNCASGKIDDLVLGLHAILDQIDPQNPKILPFKDKFALSRMRVGMGSFHRSINLGHDIRGNFLPLFPKLSIAHVIALHCVRRLSVNNCAEYTTRVDLTNPPSHDSGFEADTTATGRKIARDPKHLLQVIPPIEVGHTSAFDRQMRRLRDYVDDLEPYNISSRSGTAAMHAANLVLTGYWDRQLGATSSESVSTPERWKQTLRVIVLLTAGRIINRYGERDYVRALSVCENFKSRDTQSVKHMIITVSMSTRPHYAEENFMIDCASGSDGKNYINATRSDFIQRFSAIMDIVVPHLKLS